MLDWFAPLRSLRYEFLGFRLLLATTVSSQQAGNNSPRDNIEAVDLNYIDSSLRFRINSKLQCCHEMWVASSFNASRQQILLRTALATVPFLIYVRDNYFSLTYVRGTSMEPTIQDGDIVLIRKRDAGRLLLRILNMTPWWSLKDNPHRTSVNPNSSASDRGNSTQQQNTSSIGSMENDDRTMAMWHRMGDDDSYLLLSPSHCAPLILPGHIIVYRNPYHFQEAIVKRAIGVGGQRILTRSLQQPVIHNDSNTNVSRDNQYDNSDYSYLLREIHEQQRYRNDLIVPPHFVYTEGDNATTSIHDSRSMGGKPISQNLVIGVAEYIVWPPKRWQRLHRQPSQVNSNQNRARAIWDK
jgi:signal peptidase I